MGKSKLTPHLLRPTSYIPLPTPHSPLFRPQRIHQVHPRCPPRRNPAREEAREAEGPDDVTADRNMSHKHGFAIT